MWMNQVKTIQVNLRKMQNDPILPNPAETVWKNVKNLQMTLFCCFYELQAKTIQLNPRKIQNDPILLQQMNPDKTIQKNP